MDDPRPDEHKANIDRRKFLQLGVASAGAVVAAGCSSSAPASDNRVVTASATTRDLGFAPRKPFSAPPMQEVRIGFVGVGGMGTWHVRNLLKLDGARIQAVCDINEAHAERSRKLIVEAGQPDPVLYTRGDWDFVRMCETEELDLVYTATPWRWHVPVCTAAMKNGKHAATEVPAAYTTDGCWDLVEHAENYEKHCVMMENCSYGRAELMVLNMVRQGVLGEVLHGECGYLHDLRDIKFAPDGEGLWRREHSKTRNGNLYPTHGLGPVAQCMDVNRGDQFSYLVSMSSPSRGLQLYAQEHFPAGAPQRNETYVLGDVNASLIKTVLGRTIYVSHDTNLPRPYSRINLVQGTRGIFQGYPDRVYLEGLSKEEHRWDDAEEWADAYEHPMWQALEDRGGPHGGMDYLEDYRLIKCLKEGLPTDMNVYDAAAISAVCELSEQSVASGSTPVSFPDFTRGRWKEWEPLGIVT